MAVPASTAAMRARATGKPQDGVGLSPRPCLGAQGSCWHTQKQHGGLEETDGRGASLPGPGSLLLGSVMSLQCQEILVSLPHK